MKFINNLIDIDLQCNSKEHLFVNGNKGYVDIIGELEYKTYRIWQIDGILIQYDYEKRLYDKFVEREYIVDDNYDENLIRANIIEQLKANEARKTELYCRTQFILSYDCNFACPYCYEKKYRNSKRLTKEQVDKIFEINGNITNIGLFGGEPLLPQNKEIIEYIISKAPNATYSIITNGYYFNDFLEILKSINLIYLQITLDGDKELHNKTRILADGTGTYDVVMDSIKKSVQNNFPTTVRMNITPKNLDICLKQKKFIENQPWVNKNLRFDLQPIFQCNKDKKSKLYGALFADDLVSPYKNMILKKLLPISNFLYNDVPLKPIMKACEADFSFRFYDPLGDIYSCIASVGKQEKSVGKYWPTLKYKKDSFLTRDISSIPKCRSCKYALVCGGGCANGIPAGCSINTTPNCNSMFNELNFTVPNIYRLRKSCIKKLKENS